MQNSTSKEYGELITLQDARRRILELLRQSLDELLRNELNHEEPPWRTPVTKGWWDRMKEERIRWAFWWFIWGFRRNGRGNLNSGKEKMKTLGTRIYSTRTNSEGITHEIRIRFIVCLSFIKLNWWQAMDFAYYSFFLKKDWEVTYHKLEKVFMNHR